MLSTIFLVFIVFLLVMVVAANVRIVPPGSGICHQLNIEKFAHVVMTS